MSTVKSGSSPTVLHLSPTPLLMTQTDSFTNKKRRKSIYEIKKRTYEKDPLNCWYSR